MVAPNGDCPVDPTKEPPPAPQPPTEEPCSERRSTRTAAKVEEDHYPKPKVGDKIAISCPADPPHPAGWYSAVVMSLTSDGPQGWSVTVEWDGGDLEKLVNPDWRELGMEPDQKGRSSSLKDGRLRPHLTYIVRRIRGASRGESMSWSIEESERSNAVASVKNGGAGGELTLTYWNVDILDRYIFFSCPPSNPPPPPPHSSPRSLRKPSKGRLHKLHLVRSLPARRRPPDNIPGLQPKQQPPNSNVPAAEPRNGSGPLAGEPNPPSAAGPEPERVARRWVHYDSARGVD